MKRTAINTYLLKIASFCNLNCSYCFMFNLKDTTYQGKEKIMPLDLLEMAAAKMVDLAVRQGISNLNISFHGGEPLLAGKDWFRRAVALLKTQGGNNISFQMGLQTNGILIDDEWLDIFEENKISVGISLDGPRHINDRARLNFANDSSYNATVAGLQKVLARKNVFGGVLCVIDPDADGLEIYEHFREIGVNRLDFLWPLDHNWDTPPPSLHEDQTTPYADYLIRVFDHWWPNDSDNVRIRYFEALIRGLLGARIGLDSLGANPINIVAIDTDGSIEPLDSLRATADGLTDLGLRIQSDSIDLIYDKSLFQTAIAGQKELCQRCQECAFMDTCGGGYLPHRYSSANGFANPSVYCRDLWKLINHILAAVVSEVERPFMETGESSMITTD